MGGSQVTEGLLDKGWKTRELGSGDESPLPAPLGNAVGQMQRPELAASLTGSSWPLWRAGPDARPPVTAAGHGCPSSPATPGAWGLPLPLPLPIPLPARLSPTGTRDRLHLPWEAGTGHSIAPVQAGATFKHLLNAAPAAAGSGPGRVPARVAGSRQMHAQCQALY